MTGFASELAQMAIMAGNRFRQKKLGDEKKLQAAKLNVMQIEAALEASIDAIERSFHFQPTLRGDFQCPVCWTANGQHVSLIPLPSDSGVDNFKCPECHEPFSS
jgi:hypothetical protein